MTRLTAALQGNLAQYMREESSLVGGAVKGAVTSGTLRTLAAVRAHVDRIFASSAARITRRKVSGAIRSRIYPNQGPITTAGFINSRLGRGRGSQFEDFLLPHFRGATVRPTRGSRYLAVAAPGAGGRVSAGAQSRLAQALAGLGIGADPRIRMIPLPGGRFVIVRDPTTTKRGKLRRGARSEVLGWLVRRVQVRAKGDIGPIVEQSANDLARDLLARLGSR